MESPFVELTEIPPEGKTLVFQEDSKEFSKNLKDLTREHPFEFKFFIQPMGNAFEITTEIKATMDLDCARCGQDFEFPVNKKQKEILLVEAPSTGSHRIHWDSSEDLHCHHLESSHFDLSEYCHELLASSEPTRPMPKSECEGGECENYKEALENGWITEKSPNNPFEILKNLKPES